MTGRGKTGLDYRWLASGLTLLAVVGVQAIEPMNSLLPRAEAVPLTVTQSVTDLPTQALDETQSPDEITSGPKVELVSAIATRSLFMQSRGVIKAQSTTTSTTANTATRSDEAPSIELIGTVLSRRADVALVAEGPDKSRRLQVGDTVSDWMIVRIERDGLTLRQDENLAPVTLR